MSEPAGRVRPWGATRLAPFAGPVGVPYARLELDPLTQLTRYFDAEGQPLEMGKTIPEHLQSHRRWPRRRESVAAGRRERH
jgi:putative ATP-grasp target RiPP